jgi:hypothetical protein
MERCPRCSNLLSETRDGRAICPGCDYIEPSAGQLAASPPAFLVGLDLGQAADPSALAVLERTQPTEADQARYAVRHLERWRLGTSYPDIVAAVTALCDKPPLTDCALVVDGTGCGLAIVDLFRFGPVRALVKPVLITAGNAVSTDQFGYTHIAKIQLVSVMQGLLQRRLLKFAARLPLAKTVEKELANYKVKITAAANETFSADWREGQHDDLAFAVMLAAWFGENGYTGPWTVGGDDRDLGPMAKAPKEIWTW